VPAFLLLLFLAPLGLAQTPPPHYIIIDLGTLGGPSPVASGINSSGQVVGNSQNSANTATYAFRTATNSPINPATDSLGTLGGTSSYASGINASGQVVGTSDPTGNSIDHAFRTAPGSPINPTTDDLGTLGGYSEASAINASGQVVGMSVTPLPATLHHAFRSAPNGSPGPLVDLGTLGGTYSVATGINDSGQVVGYSSFTSSYDYPYHAFRTAPGSAINPATDDLLTLGGESSWGNGINNAGQVVGYSDLQAGSPFGHAFMTAANSPIDPETDDLGTLGGDYSWAYGINNSGQVVGYASTTGGDNHAFLYTGGGMYDLNNLVPANSGWVFQTSTAINDGGEIVGDGLYNGQAHAFLLIPAITQTLSPGGGTASFIFSQNLYNINFTYPGGFVPNDSHIYSLAVGALETSQPAWALRTPQGNPYYETQLAPVTGLGGDGIIYRAVCTDELGNPCPEPADDPYFTITTSWKGDPGTNPGFLKAAIGANTWENVYVPGSYSATRTDGGPDPTGAGKSKDGFSDWAFVYGVTESDSPATVTITAPGNNATYTLNQAMNASYICNGSYVSSCIGDVASGTKFDTTSLGTKSFTVVATVTKGNSAVQTASYSVIPAPLTVTAANVSRQYGQANPPLTATYSGFLNNDDPSSLNGTLSCTTTASQQTPVGTYPITCGGLSSPNYTIMYIPGVLTITQAVATITANNATKTFGTPNPPLTWTASGFVNGDTTLGVLTTNPACTTTATTTSPVGSYPITCSGAVALNYSFVYVSGTLTVSCHYVSITFSPATVAVGGTFTVKAVVMSCTNATQIIVEKFNLAGPLQPRTCGQDKTVMFTTPPFALPAKTLTTLSFPFRIPNRSCSGSFTITATTFVSGTAVDATSASLTVTAH
jgi:probable HAF family extracellular repeat protein